jgi:hypothetical protein
MSHRKRGTYQVTGGAVPQRQPSSAGPGSTSRACWRCSAARSAWSTHSPTRRPTAGIRLPGQSLDRNRALTAMALADATRADAQTEHRLSMNIINYARQTWPRARQERPAIRPRGRRMGTRPRPRRPRTASTTSDGEAAEDGW